MLNKTLSQGQAQTLFVASCIALLTTSMTFGIRAGMLPELGKQFGLSQQELGWATGTAFWGFTLSMIFGGPLLDLLGFGVILALAFVAHLAGIVLTIYSGDFWSLFISTLLIGIANGFVEAACNPLVASLFPDQKVKKLNQFHVWFPGGIVVGGLVSYLIQQQLLAGESWAWQLSMASILLPNLAYGLLFFRKSFPKTERVSSGVSTAGMYKALLHPIFFLVVLCMLFTAATELGTNQWIDFLLSSQVEAPILILVLINTIMAAGRYYAGGLAHRLPASGILMGSAVVSVAGLLLLSIAQGYWAIAAGAVFAVGVTYFWPTMLGFVSENFPSTGAVGLAIMGGVGMLSVALVLPLMGDLFEGNIAAALPAGIDYEAATQAGEENPLHNQYIEAKKEGATQTLRTLALMPAGLIVAFIGLFVWEKSQKKRA